MNYDWDFSKLRLYLGAFRVGTLTAVSLTAISILLGSSIGIVLGLIMGNRSIRWAFYPVIDILRALPPLVLMLCVYYLLTPQLIGVTVPVFWVAVIAMSLNLAAFTSDLVRAAVDNVSADAVDAAYAIGMSHNQVTRYIVLPRVLREIIPGMTALFLGTLKMSSLASVINVPEVVYTAQTVVARTARSLEAWALVGLIYIVLVLPTTYAVRWLERRTGQGRLARRV